METPSEVNRSQRIGSATAICERNQTSITMTYEMTNPCADCPFLKANIRGYPIQRLREFATGDFHCHKTGDFDDEEGTFIPTKDSSACAGMLIFNEKRDKPNQLMRIMERLGFYDRTKLNMKAKVR